VNLMRRARLPVRGAVAALALAWLLAAGPAAEPVEQAKSTTPPAAQPAEAPPWPNAAQLAERRREAERRQLFRSTEPVAITIAADFRAVQRDRDVTSTRMFPATITFPTADGQTASMPLLIRTRGHSRRKPTLCDFAPLRLEFQKELTKNTLFDGPRSLKLGAHCRDNGTFEQYVLREHAVYRVFNLLTPRSFRSRLAKMTYVDTKNGRTVASRFGHFIEDDDDVARRLEGRIREAKGTLFRQTHSETLTLMMLFEFMIGNTDLSVSQQHNVRLVETPANEIYPIPYDFDFSGLVNTTYSGVDKRLPIQSVRDRIYRGPCRTLEELETFFARFRALKTEIYAVYDAVPSMASSDRREARAYLDEFYRIVDRPRDLKRTFIDPCVHAGM
jgi:hypothetical protein